eukprot:scaffold572660_cov41-Prasinocladus_malaysianus.AAC.1
MCKLADDKAYGRQTQRMAAMRWMAAVVPGLSPRLQKTFLPRILVPLYRLTDSTTPAPDVVNELASE